MDNLIESIRNCYEKHSIAHRYIIAFAYKGYIWRLDNTCIDALFSALEISTDTSTKSTKVRFRVTEKNADKIMAYNPQQWLKKAEFENAFTEWQKAQGKAYNRGEYFEYLIYSENAQVWYKDNRPWYTDNDIVINGIGYQIKYQKASIATEKQCNDLGW